MSSHGSVAPMTIIGLDDRNPRRVKKKRPQVQRASHPSCWRRHRRRPRVARLRAATAPRGTRRPEFGSIFGTLFRSTPTAKAEGWIAEGLGRTRFFFRSTRVPGICRRHAPRCFSKKRTAEKRGRSASEECCRTCRASSGASHGRECNRKEQRAPIGAQPAAAAEPVLLDADVDVAALRDGDVLAITVTDWP